MKLINISMNKSEKIFFVIILFLSLLMFLFYVNLNAFENFHDEKVYVDYSHVILDHGLFDYETYLQKIRTYLYPTIIASLQIIYSDDIVITKIILSGIQYAVYLSTVIFIANYTINKNDNKIIWHSIIAFGFLNPFLIQATTLFLTDIFASCFIVLAIFSLTSIDLTRLKFVFFSIGLFYSSVMIRPSTIIFLPIVIGLILFRFLKQKHFSIAKVSLISLILLVIFIPQLYHNVTNWDEWTPFVIQPIYEKLNYWAASNLKFGGVVIPGENARLMYTSPFPVSDDVNIYRLFMEDTSTFVLVYFSHFFGVLDWDYVDTYIKDYYPDNRIPSSLLIYSTWFFCYFGYSVNSEKFF